MKLKLFILFIIFISFFSCTKINRVSILEDEKGLKLIVNEKDFFINGMNWDYIPVGYNYEYNLWEKSDNFIKKALHSEMTLLKEMGVNTIRVYLGIPPKWITYIYKNYGIYTMLNHSFGRYGVSVNNKWLPNTDYSNKDVQNQLLKEVEEMAKTFKDTPGLLLYLLGNENNYGLFWEGAETENFPSEEELDGDIAEKKARALYQAFNKAAIAIKNIDKNRPIAICNGDLVYLNIINKECKDVDILGTNMYRGKSFGDALTKVKSVLNKPIMFTEFGVDAYNALENKEDQDMQAFFNLYNWKEIYENAYGLNKAQNSIGGFTFQFSDGWWKTGQTINLDIHDKKATWLNEGYYKDTKQGSNNMNEEWFGVCAKQKPDKEGFYTLKPRLSYYALQKAHQLDVFNSELDTAEIQSFFNKIEKQILSNYNINK